jgi:hypothetical protein
MPVISRTVDSKFFQERLLGIDQENIVVGRDERLLALGPGRDFERFRHLDAERLDDRAHAHPPGEV